MWDDDKSRSASFDLPKVRLVGESAEFTASTLGQRSMDHRNRTSCLPSNLGQDLDCQKLFHTASYRTPVNNYPSNTPLKVFIKTQI